MIGLIISVFKIFFSAVLGGILGYTRQNEEKPFSVQMLMTIAVGATAFVISSLHIGEISTAADPGVLSAFTIGGIGLLGAGIIVAGKEVQVGLAIWLAGAIGVLTGVGLIFEAVIITGLAYYILHFLPGIFESDSSQDELSDVS